MSLTVLATPLNIRIAAETLRDVLGDQHKVQYPVNVDLLTRHLGYELKVVEVSEQSDLYDFTVAIDTEQKTVLINDGLAIRDKYFLAAHALGHLVLHPGESGVDYLDYNPPTTGPDADADCFAMELLMPRTHFTHMWYKHDQDCDVLSTIFGLDPWRIDQRSQELGL